MLLMVPLSYNFRSLFVRKTTTFATAFGIGLVVFVLASGLMLGAGVQKTLVSSGRPENAIVLRKGSDNELSSSIETKTANLIQAAPGIKKDDTGAPLTSGELVIVIALDKTGTDGQVSNVQVRGVPESVRKVRPEVKVVEGTWPRPGTDEVIAGKGVIDRFNGVTMGGQFELKKNRPLKVVGVFESGGSSLESEIWGDVDVVRSSFGREGLVSSVTARLDSPSKFEAFKAAMENDKQLGLEALPETKYWEKQSEGTSIFINALVILISFFFGFGAIIGAVITMHAAVAQRQREIGTLRALGFSRFSILLSFLIESTLLALGGGLVGLVAALGMTFVKVSMMNFATWQEVTFTFDPNPGVLIGSLIAGAFMGVVGGFFPALRAARVSPLEALRA
jgi:putative ABC transport system permease protein